MEYSNEMLAKIYGAYMGCNVELNNLGSKVYNRVLVGVGNVNDPDNAYYTLRFTYSLSAPTTSILFAQHDRCRLILKPLSSISDEDAIEVAKIYLSLIQKSDNSREWKLNSENDSVRVGRRLVSTTFSTMRELLPITDFLRSESYDLGYGEIPSLIDAGIAVNKNINQK